MINFLMEPRFLKTRTHFLYHNIARNERSFGVLLFDKKKKANKLSVEVLYSDHSEMIVVICYT